MRWLISFVAVLLLAVAVGLTARYAQGYVLIVLPSTRIEMSLTLFALLILLAVGLLSFLVGILRRLLQLPGRVRAYRRRRQHNRALGGAAEATAAPASRGDVVALRPRQSNSQ